MFELTIDEEGAIIIPEKVLSSLSLKEGDKVCLHEKDGKIIIEKKKSISPEEYESLIDDAGEYAKSMGLDENDCYRIVEEFIASIK